MQETFLSSYIIYSFGDLLRLGHKIFLSKESRNPTFLVVFIGDLNGIILMSESC